jgi:type IX secretion system PorP/SprF family membrane protein
MNKLLNISLLGLISLSLTVDAQDIEKYTNNYLCPFLINPALSGATYYPAAIFSVKKQWLGIPNSPSTYLLGGNYRIGTYDYYDPKGFVNKGKLELKDRMGLGAAFYGDQSGPLQSYGGEIAYAYHFPVSDKAELGLGLAITGNYYGFKTSMLDPDESADDYLFHGDENSFKINFNVGAYFKHEKYFWGLSAIRLMPDITIGSERINEKTGFYLMGGYIHKINSHLTFEPTAILNKTGPDPFSVEVYAKMYIKNYNWISLMYGSTGKAGLLFAFRLAKMVYAGYAYESSLSRIVQYNYGSHSIHLGINLGIVANDLIGNSTKP